MIKSWLSWINTALFCLSFLLIAIAGWMMLSRSKTIEIPEIVPRTLNLPKNAFAMPKEAYEAIGEPFLYLEYVPPTLKLPNLRRYLAYYGKNDRPDSTGDLDSLFFAFTRRGQDDPIPIPAKKPVYLIYDGTQQPGKYSFSPGNTETSLWIETYPEEKNATVKVAMKDDKGNIIQTPERLAEFKIPMKNFMRKGDQQWNIGKWRVDGSLLGRQRARWYGKDLFLQKHGGTEFEEFQERERLEFGEKEEKYSVFLKVGEFVIWDGERWRAPLPGEKTTEYPLLVVKSLNERLMSLEIWSPDGKGKVPLKLIKAREAWIPQAIQRSFKFLGSKTRSQFVFEINGERMVLSPQDWLLRIKDKWKKLVTPNEIDAYVDRKETGILFVFDGINQTDGNQVLAGTVFNSTRTDSHAVELPIQRGRRVKQELQEKKKNPDEDEDDEEDDNDEEGE